MVIWGIRKAFVKSSIPLKPICSNCNEASLCIKIYSRHIHVFWIPILPIGKTGFVECMNCGKQFKPRSLNENHFRAFTEQKRLATVPIWQFSGALIFMMLFAIGGYHYEKDKKQEAEYLAHPQVNDIYSYVKSNKKYSTLKVIRTTKDSVYFVANTLESTKRSKLYKIDKPENYLDSTAVFSKTELVEKYYSKVIYNIKRK